MVQEEDDSQKRCLIHRQQVPLKLSHDLDGQSILGPVHADRKENYTSKTLTVNSQCQNLDLVYVVAVAMLKFFKN